MTKEIIAEQGKYRLIRKDNKFMIEQKSGLLNFWKVIKCFRINNEKALSITKVNAYKYYNKLIQG